MVIINVILEVKLAHLANLTTYPATRPAALPMPAAPDGHLCGRRL